MRRKFRSRRLQSFPDRDEPIAQRVRDVVFLSRDVLRGLGIGSEWARLRYQKGSHLKQQPHDGSRP